MLCHQHGEYLEAWAGQAEASPVSELRGFSKGLRKAWAVVTAGLASGRMARASSPSAPPGNAIWKVRTIPVSRLP